MVHTFNLTHTVEPDDPVIKAWWYYREKPIQNGIALDAPRKIQTAKKEMVLLVLRVDCLKMFQVQNITPNDLPQIISQINKFLWLMELSVDNFNVSRIDYAFNFEMEDDYSRQCLFDLLNEKAPNSKNYLYHIKRQYNTSIYCRTRKNTTRTVNVYDKNTERKERMGFSITPKDYERDILRSEMQVKVEHIKQRVKLEHISRHISDWLTVEQYRHFISQVWQFVFRGDFYTLPTAKALIEASEYSKTIKLRLVKLLEDIAATDTETALAKYAYNTARNYIRRLDELGINPMTLPGDWDIDYIPSPFKFYSIV